MATEYLPDWIDEDDPAIMQMHGDFRYFVLHIFQHLGLPRPTKRQQAICKYLQHGPRRRMIQAFRGIGKTWLTCVYILWRLWKNPDEKCTVVSANEDKAVENAIFIRRLIDEVEILRPLRPQTGGRDSVLSFDVGPTQASVSPSVRAVGITGQLTGGRATVLVSDDVEVPKNSWTEIMRERLAQLVKEYDALVVPEGFDIIYLGTPQTEQSVYNHVKKRGYDCKIWPARFPNDKESAKYGKDLADDVLADLARGARPGTSTDPERFDDTDLAEREASYGRSGFALQFMLDTSLSDAERYPLKQSDFIYWTCDSEQAPVKLEWSTRRSELIPDLPNIGFAGDYFYGPLWQSPERKPYTGCVMAIDPSGRGKDETAVVVLKALDGMLYLVHAQGYKNGYDPVTITEMALTAKLHGVKHLVVESNFGDGMFTKIIEPHFAKIYPVTIEEVRVSMQKELRIISDIEPVLNQHRLAIDSRVVQEDLKKATEEPQYSLLYQLTHLTKERGSLRHDDLIDALAHAIRHFREAVAIDHELAHVRHREALRDEEFRKFEEEATGRSTQRHVKYAGGDTQVMRGRSRRCGERRTLRH